MLSDPPHFLWTDRLKPIILVKITLVYQIDNYRTCNYHRWFSWGKNLRCGLRTLSSFLSFFNISLLSLHILFHALHLFKTQCLLFLIKFPSPTFIPWPTSIPDSRVAAATRLEPLKTIKGKYLSGWSSSPLHQPTELFKNSYYNYRYLGYFLKDNQCALSCIVNHVCILAHIMPSPY